MLPPRSIQNNAGVLKITWSDGMRQRFDNAFLRRRCQCADCKSLRMRTGEELAVSPQMRIKEIRPIGSYAVQFVFTDGPDRGIFPWVYLKEMTEEGISLSP